MRIQPTPTHADTTTTAMRSWHDEGGVFLDVDGDHVELFGYQSADLIGTSPYALYHPADLARITAAHAATLFGGHAQIVRYRFRCADGRFAEVRTLSKLTRDSSIASVTHRL